MKRRISKKKFPIFASKLYRKQRSVRAKMVLWNSIFSRQHFKHVNFNCFTLKRTNAPNSVLVVVHETQKQYHTFISTNYLHLHIIHTYVITLFSVFPLFHLRLIEWVKLNLKQFDTLTFNSHANKHSLLFNYSTFSADLLKCSLIWRRLIFGAIKELWIENLGNIRKNG